MIKESTIEKTSLPVSWEMKIFDDVINFSQIGLVRNNKEQSLEYTYRYLKMNNINNDNGLNEDSFKFVNAASEEVKKYQLLNDDFLFNTRNSFELVGKNCLYKSDYTKPTLFNNNILRVRFKDFLFPEFAAYAFSSKAIIDNLEKIKSGTTNVVGIYYKSLKYLEIPIPPLPQQKQIVAILDKAFAAIDTAKANAEQNLQNAKELFESYLQNIFENKGDDWENKPLSEVCDLIKRGSQPKYTESEAGEIVLNQKCIRDHKINLSVARKHNTNKKTINKERYIQLGDGLINSTGTGTLGRVAQVRELNFSAFVDTHITIVRPKKELFYLDFFGWALIYIEKIVQKSGEGASGQTELSRKVVEKFIISFPNEMKQQQQTAEKLDNLSLEIKKLEAIYTQKIADLEEMKKAILEKAFKGELTSAA
jgi:type I restriction enzyme, S subunit